MDIIIKGFVFLWFSILVCVCVCVVSAGVQGKAVKSREICDSVQGFQYGILASMTVGQRVSVASESHAKY